MLSMQYHHEWMLNRSRVIVFVIFYQYNIHHAVFDSLLAIYKREILRMITSSMTNCLNLHNSSSIIETW